MKEIKLTQGQFTQVDDDVYDYLMQWKWYARMSKYGYYAMRSEHEPRVKGKKDVCHTILMHRVIMKTPDGKDVDHADFDGLNNQRFNMRNCTRMQNSANRHTWGESEYKGVLCRRRNKYLIRYTVTVCKDKSICLGSFTTEEEAARAYDIGAIKFFGDFAKTNFDRSLYDGVDIDKEFDLLIQNKEYSSWNKGLSKETNQVLLKMGESRTGTVAWNKGLTKETDERVAGYSKTLLGKKKHKKVLSH